MVEKLSVPKMNEHLTNPKGTKLLPVADYTFVLHRALKGGRFNCLQKLSLIQYLDAPVSTKALQTISPILVRKVIPLEDPTITCAI